MATYSPFTAIRKMAVGLAAQFLLHDAQMSTYYVRPEDLADADGLPLEVPPGRCVKVTIEIVLEPDYPKAMGPVESAHSFKGR